MIADLAICATTFEIDFRYINRRQAEVNGIMHLLITENRI